MKKKVVIGSLLIFILALSIVFFSCDSGSGGVSGTHTVRYVISGPPVIADIIVYSTDTSNSDSITNVPIPWEKTVTIQGRKYVSCRAIYSNINGSTYTAKIFVNGREIASTNSSSVSVQTSGYTQ
jgi:hypothetical protein